jgi:hypothetical protein
MNKNILLNSVFITLAFDLATSSLSFAEKKSFKVENDTEQMIVSMIVEDSAPDVSNQPAGNGKRKRELPLGLSPSPDLSKGNGNGGLQAGEEKRKSTKDIEIEVSEENCLADVRFVMNDGKFVYAPRLDLCGLDGIVVEETAEALVPQTEIAPANP